MIRRLLKLVLLAALLPAWVAVAQDDEPYGPQPTGAPEAAKQFAANTAAYKGNPDVLVLPGLVADRKARTVKVLVEATGLGGEEVAEFLLIDQHSSHGYEGLLWSFAKPSDVHAALVFIGLKPGAPYNPRALRFAPDGDPVILNVEDEAGGSFRIEEMILDVESGETLPEDGFIFAGSMLVPLREGQSVDVPRYAADIYDPRSVASVYSEPFAVLDVPRMVQKGEAYGNQVVNPDAVFEGGTLLTVVMTPGAAAEGASRERELTLSVGGTTNGSNAVTFGLQSAAGEVLYEGGELRSMLLAFTGAVQALDAGRQILVTLVLEDDAPLAAVPKVCAVLAVLENMGSARVQPPEAGQLYFVAFVPNRDWMDPAKRPSQPWELHVSQQGEQLSAQMVKYDSVWSETNAIPALTRTVVDIATPEAVRAQLDADTAARLAAGKSAAPAALLAYATPGMKVGDLMQFVRPALDTHGSVYVFLEEK